MRFNGLGPEWFPVVLGTLGLFLAVYVLYLVFNYYILFLMGKIIFYIVIIFYLFVLSSWIYRYIKNTKLIKSDFDNITSLSFTAFPGVLYFAMAIWAYVFPVGIATFAYYMLYDLTEIYAFVYVVMVFTVALPVFYTYTWINTHKILKHKK